MAAPKRATHQVAKRGLYFNPREGELEIGTPMTLTTTQAKKLEARGMVTPMKDVKTVDATDADTKALEAELKTTKTALKESQDALKKAEDDLETLTGTDK